MPRAIRKDFWTPLATVYFSNPYQGLEAYRQLREFSKRHYHEWKPEQIPGRSRILKGRALRNQKANSIADLAAVLLRHAEIATKHAQKTSELEQATEAKLAEAKQELADLMKQKRVQQETMSESEENKAKFQEMKRRKMKLQRDLAKPDPYNALMGNYSLMNDNRPKAKHGFGRFRGRPPLPDWTINDVRIQWADTYDAEFAATWPKQVVHETMQIEMTIYLNLCQRRTYEDLWFSVWHDSLQMRGEADIVHDFNGLRASHVSPRASHG